MTLIRLSGPPELVVTLAELKAQARIPDEDTDQNALLVGHLRAAQDTIDGAYGWLGRALTTQQWRLTLDAWPSCEVISVPLPPTQSIDSVRYLDQDGAEQTVGDFTVYGLGGAAPARLAHAYGATWPTTRRQGGAVSIDFTAGWPSFSDVPESVRAAVLLLAAGLFDGCGNDAAIQSLLLPHRIW